MTRRREVPTLAFTIPEAALAIRLSENTLRVWVREGIVGVVRWQSTDFVPRVELDRLITAALDNGGTLPASAVVPGSGGSAAAVEPGTSGAASPRVAEALGEVRQGDGPSSASLPGRSTPTTQEARRPRRASATTAV